MCSFDRKFCSQRKSNLHSLNKANLEDDFKKKFDHICIINFFEFALKSLQSIFSNAPKHTARLTKAFFEKNGVKVFNDPLKVPI